MSSPLSVRLSRGSSKQQFEFCTALEKHHQFVPQKICGFLHQFSLDSHPTRNGHSAVRRNVESEETTLSIRATRWIQPNFFGANSVLIRKPAAVSLKLARTCSCNLREHSYTPGQQWAHSRNNTLRRSDLGPHAHKSIAGLVNTVQRRTAAKPGIAPRVYHAQPAASVKFNVAQHDVISQ